MKRNHKLGFALAAVLAAALTLSACGGGGGDSVMPPVAGGGGSGGGSVDSSMVPDGIGASAAAFMAFIQSLAMGDETSEPLTFSAGFTPPAEDNTSEPAAL